MIRVTVQTLLSIKKILGTRELATEVPDGSTVLDVLHGLGEEYGEVLEASLFQSPGQIKDHLVLMLNGRDIRVLNGIITELKDGDELLIFPPAGGG